MRWFLFSSEHVFAEKTLATGRDRECRAPSDDVV